VIRVALVLACIASTARADARFFHTNDAFTDLTPPLDDQGFTADLGVAFWRPYRGYLVGGAVFDRWLTEVGGFRREDLLELAATAERSWGEHRVRELTIAMRSGPVVTGNWGGRWMQNAWHSVSGTGPTLDSGHLANTYPADRAFGWLAGGRAVGAAGIDAVQLYGVVDTQGSVGTGVSWLELGAGLRVFRRVRCVELGAHAEIALDRYAVADATLTLRGGYGTDAWERAWRAGVHVAWHRTMIAYEYRANEGGSGEPVGMIAVTIAQSGHTF
jgi:hypothetical protein